MFCYRILWQELLLLQIDKLLITIFFNVRASFEIPTVRFAKAQIKTKISLKPQ